MNAFTTYFSGLSRAALLIFALAMVLAVGITDYLTGYYLGFFLFYLIPISFAAWFGGLLPAVVISLASAASWFMADWISNPNEVSHVFTIWNTAIRLAVFLIISFALWRIRVYQQKNRALVEFIVHDLRSPLATISMGLGQLKEGGCEELGDREKNILKACRISAARMFTLVNAILDISKMESKHLKPAISEGRIGDILRSVAEETSIFAEKEQVILDRRVDVASELIHADTGLLVRILVNLISNAIKVSPAGSSVYIAVSDESKDRVRFSVTDRGCGIPKKMVGRIFDKFTQIGTAKSDMIPGSGLGLTFCKLAVEALGGRIHIESKEGEGTTVSFALPVRSKQALTFISPSPPEMEGRVMRFLLFCLLFALIACRPLLAEDDDSLHPNRSAVLDEFDDNMNGATMLVDDVAPVNREALMEEHREDEDWAMEDEMWGIDDELWHEHARKKGWLDED